MKKWLLILILLFTTKLFSLDYPKYVKSYLDKVNNTKVKNGVCIDLIFELFKPIEDSMLIDINKMIWGSPIFKLSDIKSGDIIIYDNHIVIAYDRLENGDILIADQNRNGDSSGVLIHLLDNKVRVKSNFQIFRPIVLSDISYSKEHDKNFYLKLYTINIKDREKMNRSKYNIPYDASLKPYIIDTSLDYTNIEYQFAKYYNGKVLCEYGKKCFIKIEKEKKLIVEKVDREDWKPIKIKK